MPIAWHPKRWQNFFMSKEEKKEIETIVTEKCFWCTSVVYNIRVSRDFNMKI